MAMDRPSSFVELLRLEGIEPMILVCNSREVPPSFRTRHQTKRARQDREWGFHPTLALYSNGSRARKKPAI
jgi:hypothetical protein